MTVLLYQNGEIKLYPQGYKIDGVLQPLGELQTGVQHLDYVPAEKPATELNEYATSEWVVEGIEYKQVWTVHEFSQEEIELREAQADWTHPEWAKRIVAPLELALDDTGAKIAIWFQLNGFPVEKVDDTTLHLYCNVILPQHQAIVDGFGEAVTIEDRPQVLGLKIKVL